MLILLIPRLHEQSDMQTYARHIQQKHAKVTRGKHIINLNFNNTI